MIEYNVSWKINIYIVRKIIELKYYSIPSLSKVNFYKLIMKHTFFQIF